jgi:hypothetical protein
MYQGKPLNDKSVFLRDIMSANAPNEVTVTSKSELEAYADQAASAINLFQQYPIAFGGAIVALLFFVLFVMGGGAWSYSWLSKL